MFDENSSWRWNSEGVEVPTALQNEEDEDSEQPQFETNSEQPQFETNSEQPQFETNLNEELPTPLRVYTKRSNQPPQQKTKTLQELFATTQAFLVADPECFEEAAGKEEWVKAMKEEMRAIEENNTWELVELPKDHKEIGVKWVYKTKLGPDGKVLKYKARLVVKGYAQRQGIDYNETFSPVARFETVRLLFALAVQLEQPIFQLDVKSAFLNGELMEEVYVEQPEGFKNEGKENWVYRLYKALYGLKQAPRAWYSKVDACFQTLRFTRSKNVPNLYIKHNIGLEIEQEKGHMFISQRKYAKDLVEKFGMKGCNLVQTPSNVNEKLIAEDGTENIDATRFRSLVGGLMYLTHTRPDISHSVGVISRFMQTPTKQHMGAARRILRYVAGTTSYGLWYKSVENPSLIGYSDSDWAGSLDDRRSTSGQVFFYGDNAICWNSKKQSTVALSTAEAEYNAVTSAARQGVWLRRMLEELNCKQKGATIILCDNQSTIAMSKNPVFHSRTKHIDTKQHFIRELVEQKEIELEYVNTNEQVADIMTKALAREKFVWCRRMMDVDDFGLRGSVEYNPSQQPSQQGA